MNQKTPEIGIALAAYLPPEDYFYEQLVSIQNQTFQSWICIITFDSDVPEYLNTHRFQDIKNDPRFKFFRNDSKLGHKKNFECASKKIVEIYPEISYISFSDQDDIWYPNKLADSFQAIKTLPDFSAIHTDMNLLRGTPESFMTLKNPDGSLVRGWDFEGKRNYRESLIKFIPCNHVAGAAMLMDKRIIRDYGTIPDSFEFHDHWYALVAFLKGEIHAIPTPTYLYRQHGNNVTGASKGVGLLTIRSQKSAQELVQVWRERFMTYKCRALDIARFFPSRELELKAAYLQSYDFGLKLFISFIGSFLKNDLRTARTLLGASIGKFILAIAGELKTKPSTK